MVKTASSTACHTFTRALNPAQVRNQNGAFYIHPQSCDRLIYTPNRVIDCNGISNGANIYFFEVGTTTPVSIYSDSALTTPVSNPFPISAGVIVPALYYAEANVRVRVVDSSGATVSDDDPYERPITQVELASAAGAGLSGFSHEAAYPAGTVGITMIPRVTRVQMAAIPPVVGKMSYLNEAGREGFFVCVAGANPADAQQGIYVDSDTASFYWERLWDQQNGKPEWFGVKANDASAAAANDTKIAACYTLVPHTRFGPHDYWTTTTIKAGIDHHKISGVGEKFNDQFGAMTRIVCTSGTADIVRVGPDAFPGSINALPQGIEVRDIMLSRSVAPVIASGCRGLYMTWVLNAVVENVKTSENMIGFEESGTVHCRKTNCEAVRAVAGTGPGTDYFWGHYENGGSGIAAGGNASLYHYYCSAGCNYGPLQTVPGSIGFHRDQAFTDVWYYDNETVNFYYGEATFGDDAGGLVFSNTDLTSFHPIHDQFHGAGSYTTDVAASGSHVTVEPYYGPAPDARAAYWVNSSEGAVTLRGGQFVMGAAPTCQAILLLSSRGCDVLGYPAVLEHGATFPVLDMADVSDTRVEVFAKNPNVTGQSVVQVTGTCTNIQVAPKTSGKASAYSFGTRILSAGVTRSTFNVSGTDSVSISGGNKLDWNGTPIVAAGAIAGSTTNLAEGNFA